MKKFTQKKMISLLLALVAIAGFVACSDFVGQYKDEYEGIYGEGGTYSEIAENESSSSEMLESNSSEKSQSSSSEKVASSSSKEKQSSSSVESSNSEDAKSSAAESSSSAVEKCTGTVIYDASAGNPFAFGVGGESVYETSNARIINDSDKDGLGASVLISRASDNDYGLLWFGYQDRVVDVSDWGGLCIVYKTDANIEFGTSSLMNDGGKIIDAKMYVSLENTNGKYARKDFSWDAFSVYAFIINDDYKQISIGPNQALSSVRSLYAGLVLRDETGSANFKISQITTKNALANGSTDLEKEKKSVCENGITYDPETQYCNDLDEPVYRCVEGSKNCLYWNGKEAAAAQTYGAIANGTRYKDPYFLCYGDACSSKMKWPVSEQESSSFGYLNSVIKECNGICVKYTTGGCNLATFDISAKDVAADMSRWGGLCISYVSRQKVELVLGKTAEGQKKYYEYVNKVIDASEMVSTVRLRWTDIDNEAEALKEDSPVLKYIQRLEFKSRSSEGDGTFTLFEVGSYNQCQGKNGGFQVPAYDDMSWCAWTVSD